jgi:hypothetical protein
VKTAKPGKIPSQTPIMLLSAGAFSASSRASEGLVVGPWRGAEVMSQLSCDMQRVLAIAANPGAATIYRSPVLAWKAAV